MNIKKFNIFKTNLELSENAVLLFEKNKIAEAKKEKKTVILCVH